MACAYCGIAARTETARCENCGAPSTGHSGEAAVYERIGRVVMERHPNEAIERIVGIGERECASDRERAVSRAAKAIFLLIVLWQFPLLLAFLVPLALLFTIWIYLPYRGLRALLSWLSS